MAEALEAQLPTSVVAWTLEHFQGDAYLLTNSGTANAYQVHLDLGDIQIVHGERDLEVLRAGEAHKFIAARGAVGMQGHDRAARPFHGLGLVGGVGEYLEDEVFHPTRRVRCGHLSDLREVLAVHGGRPVVGRVLPGRP